MKTTRYCLDHGCNKYCNLIGQEEVTNCDRHQHDFDRHLQDFDRHLQVHVTYDLNLLDTV